MRPELLELEKFEEGNPVNKERDKFNRRNEALLYHNDPVGVLFIGDSITAYWDLDSYFELTNGKRIINRGISNDRSMYLKRRFQADALQLKPDYIILSIGVNNTKDLDQQLDQETSDQLVLQITQDIKDMVSMAETQHIPMAITSVTATNRRHLKSFELRAATIKRINDELQQFAQRQRIPYIDYYSRMTLTGDVDCLNPELSDDGLHPHVLGYDIMAQTVVDTLTDVPLKLKHP
ncbi:GDSL-type esterase/lipase family protein [Macrococcus equipercicus]|uniref:G-D-S-L family lipolytic protein n=1 Tax=Macrococcus equipercicus TaxID=69967 RepID=A0A9Q9F190_9STAP|nr:GDSL-type esterase/lipase family protein [Macrococcus equipercicus]UTH13136.1 G-D-S-L family lipolytic protein [Macrococcus equipercicus]